ncbi:MAG TPA: SDR family oxidoreductase [Noviherbaspirillum sp.]
MFDLQGTVCLVTGASGFIGSQVCRALAGQGATVVALYHEHPEGVDATAVGGQPAGDIYPLQLDLSQRNAVAAAVTNILEEHGRIDVLVYTAGTALRKSAMLTSYEDCDRVFELNFKAVAQLCRTVLRPMFRQSSGRIILIGSTAGERGLAGQSVYAASKAAVHAYARSLAQEVGDKGITVNVVAPGALTGSGSSIYTAQDEDRVKELIGLRRLGQAHEVAAAVAFLASHEASYISGAILPVDGAARF